MQRSVSNAVVLGVVVILSLAANAGERSAGPDFMQDIQPILAGKCYECHGPDKGKGGLRLNERRSAMGQGESGKHAIVPGHPENSELIARLVTTDPDEKMPSKGEPLTPKQVDTLRRWIAAGANWQEHWAYRPIQTPTPPKIKKKSWARTPIDNFVAAKLDAAKIAPSPEADRYTLIKRLSYDLVGLPPTPEEVDAFVADKSADAYDKLVDRLLQSPHFGERWGRHWLDKARYADSDGYEKDNARPDAYKYRDWVINAVNADMPFDQFTVEQLAGDLLPNATQSQIVATAFNRQTLTNTEGGVDKEQFRVEAVFDRVETFGAVWLGLTVGCARCHTHKYDQIAHREYYSLFAFFNNGDEVSLEIPESTEAMQKYQQEKAAHDEKLKPLQEKFDAAKAPLAPKLAEWEQRTQQLLKTDAADALKYHPFEVLDADSTGEVTLKRLEDDSYLATGDPLDDGEYTLALKTKAKNITGFRLEMLPDNALPKGGPGRADNGNFVLSEFRVQVVKDGEEHGAPVALHEAAADYSQPNYPVKNAIDGDLKTGWAVGPQMNKSHTATFKTTAPLTLEAGQRLIVKMEQHHGNRHMLGRFRIMAVTGTRAPTSLPEAVKKILAVEPAKRNDAQREQLLNHYASIDSATAPLAKQYNELVAQTPKSPLINVRVIGQRTKEPRKTQIFKRGEFLQPGDEVQPGVLASLHPLKQPDQNDTTPNRLDLANWVVNPANPLTARVAVNQMWSNLFGRGLVRTVNDFGVRGEPPTHPELLDWLAHEFMQRGWSMKKMIRLMVTSATYRQSSRHRPELLERDAQNALLYRQNRFRAEAEIIRDITLAASGLLAPQVGGPSVFPPLPPDIAALSYANSFKWNTSTGADRYRRGMYTFFKRTAPHPNLTTFDCPDSNTTTVERRQSNTPLQALTTLNNECFTEAAQALSKRLLTAPLAGDAERIAYAFRLCVARPVTEAEKKSALELLNFSREWYAKNPAEATKLLGAYAPKDVPPADAAAWVATTRIIMNLDEFLCRE